MKKIFYTIALIAFSVACKESYDPPVISTDHAFLVVEGFINNGTDSTVITLSHTYKLNDTSKTTPETNAQVTVEGSDNASYILGETGDGNYGAALTLNPAVQYRLDIKTNAGKEYRSDFVPLKASPPIDSINWKRTSDGVQIYANTHDPQNASVYYKWSYIETWQFHSVYTSSYKYLPPPDDTLIAWGSDTFYTCWTGQNSSTILVGSSARLAQDLIYEAPLVTIPTDSWHISGLYSILVKQEVLTREAYDFWLNLQKNTEEIGSVFSPQPSEIKGNIHSESDPAELVIGFVSAGTQQQKRIFIDPTDIPDWTRSDYPNSCARITIIGTRAVLAQYLSGVFYNVYYPIGLTPLGQPPMPPFFYDISSSYCIDCTNIGTNQKPSFWP